jgi:type II secretory pathway component PulC
VFIAVGYFRFFQEKKDAMPSGAAPQPEMPLVVPDVKNPKSFQDGRVRIPVAERRPAVVRDVFTPGESAPSPEGRPPSPDGTPIEKQQTAVSATFKLKGTIVADNRPLAIINDRFVRTGDEIEGYRVVKIETKRVWLESGNHRVVVGAMPYE